MRVHEGDSRARSGLSLCRRSQPSSKMAPGRGPARGGPCADPQRLPRHGRDWFLQRRLSPSAGLAEQRSDQPEALTGPWRNPGDDLEIETPAQQRRPTQPNALTCTFSVDPWSSIFQGLIQDEEVVGSNPTVPAEKYQVKSLILTEDQALLASLVIVWEKSGRRSWSGSPGRTRDPPRSLSHMRHLDTARLGIRSPETSTTHGTSAMHRPVLVKTWR